MQQQSPIRIFAQNVFERRFFLLLFLGAYDIMAL